MKLRDAVPYWFFVSFVLVAVVLAAGCTSAVGGAKGPLVRQATPGPDGEVVLDEATVPTKQLTEVPDAPAVLSPEQATPAVAAEGTEEAPTPAVAAAAIPEYRIQAGDVLDFQSLDDELLNRGGVVVRYDGYVSLPLIPDVEVQGKTREEATELLREAYKPLFKDTPQVALTIASANSRYYHVAGAVQSPGEFPYVKPISVLAAINKAGGIRTYSTNREEGYVSQQGQLVKAFVIRHTETERDVFSVNLQDITQPGPHPSETPVIPGDIVFVPEGLNLIYVLGEVRRPAVYHWTEGLNMLQLLAAVGGPEFRTGRMAEVVLIRQVDEQNSKVYLVNVNRMLKTGETIGMQPGDVLFVPRKRLVKAQEFVQRFTGVVSPVLSLYTQAYDAYYTDERFDAIFDEPGGQNNVLGVIQGLRDFSGLIAPLTPALP